MCSFTLFLERKICNGNIFSTYYSKMNGILLALSKGKALKWFHFGTQQMCTCVCTCNVTIHEFKVAAKGCIIGKYKLSNVKQRWNDLFCWWFYLVFRQVKLFLRLRAIKINLFRLDDLLFLWLYNKNACKYLINKLSLNHFQTLNDVNHHCFTHERNNRSCKLFDSSKYIVSDS